MKTEGRTRGAIVHVSIKKEGGESDPSDVIEEDKPKVIVDDTNLNLASKYRVVTNHGFEELCTMKFLTHMVYFRMYLNHP